MCTGAEVLPLIVGGVSTAVQLMGSKGGGGSSTPITPPAVEKPPQASKAPNTDVLKAQNKKAATGGTSSTLLTGASGIDPMMLDLGKATLLGQ